MRIIHRFHCLVKKTSFLQLLNVSLNKLFKDGVQKQWMQWMADRIHEFAATGRQKKASEERICLWISQAWNGIPSEMIAASFLSVASQTIWMDHKMNWFTIQPRTLMNLMIQSSKTYLNQTLSRNLKVSLFRNALFKDTEHFTWIERSTVMILKLPAVLWVEIPVMFMNCCYVNNSSYEFRYTRW